MEAVTAALAITPSDSSAHSAVYVVRIRDCRMIAHVRAAPLDYRAHASTRNIDLAIRQVISAQPAVV